MRFAEIESCRETKIVIEPAATDKLRILDGSGAWRSSETMAQQALQGQTMEQQNRFNKNG
jgi:hypothetical protein